MILAKIWLASQCNLHFDTVLVTLYLKTKSPFERAFLFVSVQFKCWMIFNEHYFVTQWCQAITSFLKLFHLRKKYSRLGPRNIKSYVTVSGKTGLIAHSQISRNGGFKYSRCYSLPMVVATRTKFSHVLQQSITFQILQ